MQIKLLLGLILLGILALLAFYWPRISGMKPRDFNIVYCWKGSVSSGYRELYKITLGPSQKGKAVFCGDYSVEPTHIEEFGVKSEDLGRLYRLAYEKGVFKKHWREIPGLSKKDRLIGIEVTAHRKNFSLNNNVEGSSEVISEIYSLMQAIVSSTVKDYEEAFKAYKSGDYENALSRWTLLADEGAPDAQNYLGLMYTEGQGVSKDYAEALKWYRKAAESGQKDAQNALGMIYMMGRGVPKDDNEASKWYLKAAESGHREAQFNLGLMYSKGQWYKRDPAEDSEKGQRDIGSMYKAGGLPKDEKEAAKWYLKAAEQGHKKAQYNLSVMYANGQGLVKDGREAEKWLSKSREIKDNP